MSCKECEALGLLLKEHLAKVAVSETNLTGVGNGSGDTECLESFSDSGCSIGSLAASLLDSDGSTYGVCPLSVFEADGLNALDQMINIKSCVLSDLLSLIDGPDTVLSEFGKDLGLSSFIRFKLCQFKILPLSLITRVNKSNSISNTAILT